jgi:protoporphyrinogen oxidase
LSKKALVIGAGPAGLTVAYELLERTDIQPIVLEKTNVIGGIAQTARYKGNRIDIGGHRFFSKSDRVLQWWKKRLPIHEALPSAVNQNEQDQSIPDKVMLIRNRLSRIYFLRKFFDYPLKANLQLVKNLGLWRLFRCMFSYIYIRMFPLKHEDNLEQFFVNRFGWQLYRTFFESYTEKVWGCPCHQISAAWGAQRVKGLSITQILRHALRRDKGQGDIEQKNTETSLIERFLYPKFGPGQMWELAAESISEMGGEVLMNHQVVGIESHNNRLTHVRAKNTHTGEETVFEVDYVFSSMPVQSLLRAMGDCVPGNVSEIGEGLEYRDFLTVGLLLEKMSVDDNKHVISIPEDNWIYIQEKDVKLARLQIFNNWSPYLLADPEKVWVGLEYFCDMSEPFWNLPDQEMIQFAINELVKIELVKNEDVLDGVVVRMEKAYPAYFGTYEHFDVVKEFLNGFENLYPIGRNGMHRYNNQDHSMLTAMISVDNIVSGRLDKDNIWSINTEKTYHEKKQ